MKNITILVGFEASEAVINSLAPGTMVELRREPDNLSDANAIQAFLDGSLVGYVAADPNKTVIKGTTSNVTVAKQMDREDVAGCWAKLVAAHPYGEDNKRMRWEAKLYWLPVWGEKDSKKDNTLTLKVGGSRVTYSDITAVMGNIDNYKGEKLLVKMDDISPSGSSSPIPVVWVAATMNERGASPAGMVVDPPRELVNALAGGKTLFVEPVKVLGGGNYEVTVNLETTSISDFYDDMDMVIKKGIMQARYVKERVNYLLSQAVPAKLIHGVLQDMKRNDTGIDVIRPRQLFLQTVDDDYLTRSLGYHLAGKNIRLVGEKGSGKNTLVYTVCWVMNKALARVQGNSDMDKIDLLGGQALDDHGTHFELSSFVDMLIKGGDVVLDEINSVKPEIAIILHSLADDARSVEVPGYGFVKMHEDSRIWATMNEDYVGTGMLNSATADRFVPIFLKDQMDLGKLLKEMVPDADSKVVDACVTLYGKLRKAVHEGKCSGDVITTRGFIDALEAAKWLPVRTALLDNVGNRPQDNDDRLAVCGFIRELFPA